MCPMLPGSSGRSRRNLATRTRSLESKALRWPRDMTRLADLRISWVNRSNHDRTGTCLPRRPHSRDPGVRAVARQPRLRARMVGEPGAVGAASVCRRSPRWARDSRASGSCAASTSPSRPSPSGPSSHRSSPPTKGPSHAAAGECRIRRPPGTRVNCARRGRTAISARSGRERRGRGCLSRSPAKPAEGGRPGRRDGLSRVLRVPRRGPSGESAVHWAEGPVIRSEGTHLRNKPNGH